MLAMANSDAAEASINDRMQRIVDLNRNTTFAIDVRVGARKCGASQKAIFMALMTGKNDVPTFMTNFIEALSNANKANLNAIVADTGLSSATLVLAFANTGIST